MKQKASGLRTEKRVYLEGPVKNVCNLEASLNLDLPSLCLHSIPETKRTGLSHSRLVRFSQDISQSPGTHVDRMRQLPN